MLVEISQKARVSRMTKVLGTYFAFKGLGDVDAKGSSVRHPRNGMLVRGLR